MKTTSTILLTLLFLLTLASVPMHSSTASVPDETVISANCREDSLPVCSPFCEPPWWAKATPPAAAVSGPVKPLYHGATFPPDPWEGQEPVPGSIVRQSDERIFFSARRR